MKKCLWLLCLLAVGCNHPAEPTGQRPDAPVADDDTEQPDTLVVVPDPPSVVVPKVDGFGWVDYGLDRVKVQFKIHNAEECGMQSAVILYGTDENSLIEAKTDVYSNGIITAKIRRPDSGVRNYLVLCEVLTPEMVYRTEFFSIRF